MKSVNDLVLPNITKLSCTEISALPHTVTKADNYRCNSAKILHTNKEIRMYGESEEAAPVSYYSDLQIFWGKSRTQYPQEKNWKGDFNDGTGNWTLSSKLMAQNGILHTMKEEGKGQRHLRKENARHVIKIWERTHILEVAGISQSARRFPTQKINCIMYLAFTTNV